MYYPQSNLHKRLPSNIYKATPIVAMLGQQQQQSNQVKHLSYMDVSMDLATTNSISMEKRKSLNIPSLSYNYVVDDDISYKRNFLSSQGRLIALSYLMRCLKRIKPSCQLWKTNPHWSNMEQML